MTVPAAEFSDMQGLLYTGYGTLPEACFLLLRVADAPGARAWLSAAEVTTADQRNVPAALQVALTAGGMRALGVPDHAIDGFSAEFLSGMAGLEGRSRRLGDVGTNAPACWQWAASADATPDVMVMLYAGQGGLAAWRRQVEDAAFGQAFTLLRVLDTSDMDGHEPFGFLDGVSQPRIDWRETRAPDGNASLPYGNLISPGEFVLGYRNEYGLYTDRPLLDGSDAGAHILPPATDDPDRRDLGRNGSYLAVRELRQDVAAFWRFVASQAEGHAAATALAEAMVGRRLEGERMVPSSPSPIAGVGSDDDDVARNQFTYDGDAEGRRCPIGAHVRRANPRTGDMPGEPLGVLARLVRMLGIGRGDLRQDVIAASRFHRLLRRGREFGTTLSPEAAMRAEASGGRTGLNFICLNANIARQFEFIQNAWLSSAKFAGLGDEADPLLGNRAPLASGEATDNFSLPQTNGVRRRLTGIPPFVTVAGGAYFFLPGVRALRYLAGAGAP